MRPSDSARLSVLIALGAIVALAVWAREDLKTWLQPLFKPAVQTFVQPPPATCSLPTEHEQMVVVFFWREGSLRHRCLFTGSRGTYRAQPQANQL